MLFWALRMGVGTRRARSQTEQQDATKTENVYGDTIVERQVTVGRMTKYAIEK